MTVRCLGLKLTQIKRDPAAVEAKNVVKQRMPRSALICLTLGRPVDFAKQCLDIRRGDLQLAVGLLVHREDVVSSLGIALVLEDDKRGDGVASSFFIAQVAELVDEGAEELFGILNVDLGLERSWLGRVTNGIDQSHKEDDGLEELVDDARG